MNMIWAIIYDEKHFGQSMKDYKIHIKRLPSIGGSEKTPKHLYEV